MNKDLGLIVKGAAENARHALERWNGIPVDWDLTALPWTPYPTHQRTLKSPVTISGPGTFMGKAQRTLTLEPCEDGWWFDRQDVTDALPTLVSARNVWTTGQIVSNIVLRSGMPGNYIRMVEHMVALKVGLGLDNLMIRLESGDPPLFDRGSLDLVEAIEKAGFVEQPRLARYWTVKEPVTAISHGGGFITLRPCRTPEPKLLLDCTVDFKTAIGCQRIVWPVSYDTMRTASVARTNTSAVKMLYCATLGKIFADIRNLGYNTRNIQIAGYHRYWNEPRLLHNGKSLEAVWHRAALDLLAAIALIEGGRFVGEVTSYRAGHHLDVQLITELYRRNLLTEFKPAAG